MKNKLLSVICSIAFIFTFIPFGTFQITVNAALFKGSGTANDPYQISSKNDLFKLANLINDEDTNPKYRYCYYIQTRDIDLEEELWTPIGIFYSADGETLTANAIFAGSYDGQYHSIYNLNVDYDERYSGLFGRIGEAAGYDNGNCIISNLSIYGNVQSTADIVGGIAGEIGYGSAVKNCSVNCNVSGTYTVGGITGSICAGGTIENCYFNGTITALDKAAGIVYFVNIGKNKNSKDAIIRNCYAAGSITSGENKAGILGEFKDNAVISNSISVEKNYYLITMADKGTSDGIAGCTKFSVTALKACADMLGTPFVDNNESDEFNKPVLKPLKNK